MLPRKFQFFHKKYFIALLGNGSMVVPHGTIPLAPLDGMHTIMTHVSKSKIFIQRRKKRKGLSCAERQPVA
jgi:hypothetical protein